MINQFITTCKHCGKPILMTKCEETGKWIPCDPEANLFLPSGGPETYINERGKQCRGIRDRNGETGYKKHYLTCEVRWHIA